MGLDVSTVATALANAQGWSGWTVAFVAAIWWIKGLPDRRRAESDAVAALHKDYGAHIDLLQQENMGLRQRIEAVEQHRAEDRKKCIEENDELRELIRGLKNQVDGLQRAIAQHSQSAVIILGSGND